jgi:polyhydroxyalkanoate synthase
LDGLATTLDRSSFAAIAQLTSGQSPATLAQSFSDWWTHILCSPGRQLQLAAKGGRKLMRLADYACAAHPAAIPSRRSIRCPRIGASPTQPGSAIRST